VNKESIKVKSNIQAPSPSPARLMVFTALAAVYLLWGSTYLGIKYAIETLPPFLMAGTRFTFAGAMLYAWARLIRKDAQPLRAHWRTSFIVGGLLLLCGNGGVVWAERSIPSSLAALLVATEPLWIVLLNWVRKEGVRPNLKVVLGLLVGFAGVWLLVGGGTLTSAHSGGSQLFGASFVLLAAFAWACGSLYSVRAPASSSPLLAAGMQMTAGGALLLLAGTLMGEWTRFDLGNASARSLLAFLYLLIFGSFIGFTAYSWLLRNVRPALASTYAYVNPVVAVLLGWVVAGEPLGARTLLSAAIIIASVALITSHSKPSMEKTAGE